MKHISKDTYKISNLKTTIASDLLIFKIRNMLYKNLNKYQMKSSNSYKSNKINFLSNDLIPKDKSFQKPLILNQIIRFTKS